MNSPCHIHPPRLLQVLLLACVLCAGTGCTAWHKAQTVIREADSLDTRGIIYPDTAALQQFIRTWDKPGLNLLMHNSLGKAYYYLGRNREDRYQQYVSAAECYIRSDQLHMSDPVRRGRVNSCMGYLCGKGGEFGLETGFYQRAINAFQESGNTYYYAHSLLDLSASKRMLGDYRAADSLSHIVAQNYYDVDESIPPRIYLLKGICLNTQNEPDSALWYLQNAWEYHKTPIDSCFCALQLMRVYLKLDSLDISAQYAQYILSYAHSDKLSSQNVPFVNEYGIDAYYVLMQQAERDNATQTLADYSHKRADMFRTKLNKNSALMEAVTILGQYLENTQNKTYTIYTKVILLMCIVICIAGVCVYHKRQRNKLSAIANENLALKQVQQEAQSKIAQQYQDQKARIEEQIEQYTPLFL